MGRSFAWLDRYPRLARGWEAASWSACAFIYIGASNLIARRLAHLWAIRDHFEDSLSEAIPRPAPP